MPASFDQFFQEQCDQLRAKGYAPEEAAEISLQAQEACLEAFRQALDLGENSAPPTRQERLSGSGRAQS